MIVGNTMALAMRERTREIGVLKTLGFSGARILRMVLGESDVCWRCSAACPASSSRCADRSRAARQPDAMWCRRCARSHIATKGSALMFALGMITGLLPALNAMRLKIATALGRS